MKILGIGLPRTGTTSLAAALAQLGYNVQPAHRQGYPLKIHDCPSDLGMDDFRLFDEFEAIAECEYWRWLIHAYPEANCILTIRNPDDWFRSITAHIDAIHTRQRDRPWWKIEEADRTHERLFGSKWPLRTLYLDAYERHLFAVEAFCRSVNRPLLTFRVEQGWKPLCTFLGKPVPTEPFPWRNRLATKEP